MPEGIKHWSDAQTAYEQYRANAIKRDSFQEYMNQISSAREIYTEEYHLEGKVLDIGGNQGRLRHFLGAGVSLYVSVDPYIDIFSGMGLQPNLLRAFPCLSQPCNFIAAHAEYLPFKSGAFDWLHMRSVVDHFADPYVAFLEAYRCAKVGGKLLVGLKILEDAQEWDEKLNGASDHPAPAKASLPIRMAEKLRREGFLRLLHAIFKRFRHFKILGRPASQKDDHLFRLTRGVLFDLFGKTGWDVVKEHRQKPPFQDCIYASGQKRESIAPASQSAALAGAEK